MYWADLNIREKISFMKREFISLVKNVFENPETLKIYIDNKYLTSKQSKLIFEAVSKLNSKSCLCCRKFDQSKLQFNPVDKNLEPLLDVAQNILKTKHF